MKKREITNEELEQLFNKIIEQKPLINEEQVHSLIYNLPKASSGNAIKNFFQNHLNTLIFGTIVLSIVVGVALWVNSSHKKEKPVVQNIQQENEYAPASNDTTVVAPAVDIIKKVVQDTVTEDTSLKTTSSEISQTDTIQSVSDIYKRFDKKPQLFSIQANRDTIIFCEEGTSIKILANSFIIEGTGKEVTGELLISVKEYYKISDIILSNLSTTSGDRILETGGMLHISVVDDNEDCILKQGSNIEYGFPYSNKKDDMALFSGEWAKNTIDWKLSEPLLPNIKIDATEVNAEPVVADEVFLIVEEMPEFPGGERALSKWRIENTRYPFSALKDKIEGRVYVNFIVDKFGFATNIRITRSLDRTLDKVAVYMVRSMPKWKPAMQRGKPVNVSYTIPVDFAFEDKVLTEEEIRQSMALDEKIKEIRVDYGRSNSGIEDEDFRQGFEKKAEEGNLKKTTVSDVNRYIFSASFLGWINCDRFISLNKPKTNYSLLIDQPNKTIINIVFHKFNSVILGCAESDLITFKNMPLGEKVTIVAIEMVNGNPFLAIKETEITDNVETELDFKPVTMDLLKKEMEKLNKKEN